MTSTSGRTGADEKVGTLGYEPYGPGGIWGGSGLFKDYGAWSDTAAAADPRRPGWSLRHVGHLPLGGQRALQEVLVVPIPPHRSADPGRFRPGATPPGWTAARRSRVQPPRPLARRVRRVDLRWRGSSRSSVRARRSARGSPTASRRGPRRALLRLTRAAGPLRHDPRDLKRFIGTDTQLVADPPIIQGPVRSASEPSRGNYPNVRWVKDGGSKECPAKLPACHPVNGKGETGTGWNIVEPGPVVVAHRRVALPGRCVWKHTANDGRHDVYADEAGKCPTGSMPDAGGTLTIDQPRCVEGVPVGPACSITAAYATHSPPPNLTPGRAHLRVPRDRWSPLPGRSGCVG